MLKNQPTLGIFQIGYFLIDNYSPVFKKATPGPFSNYHFRYEFFKRYAKQFIYVHSRPTVTRE